MGSPLELRDGLLATLAAAEERESELVRLVDDTPSEPGAPWNAKDHVAHLSAWRLHAAGLLAGATHGAELAEVQDIDAFNLRVYDAWRLRPGAEVRRAAQDSYQRLRDVLGTTPEPALRAPRRDGEQPLWTAVIGNGCEHVAEHLSYWALQHGDDAAAERVAAWSCELITGVLDEPAAQGAALYNYACFFGRAGRAGDAVPLLTRALHMRPDLRSVAAGDPDFEPLRQHEEFMTLLAER